MFLDLSNALDNVAVITKDSMLPKISVIIPHKPTSENDKSLRMNLQYLLEGSTVPLEVILDTTVPKDPYRIWNEAASQARADIIVFSNSDVIMAPGWDVFFAEHCAPNRILTGYLVEPGNIYPADVNIHMDFGKTPDEFNYIEFCKFVIEHSQHIPDVWSQRGWYMPCAMNRDWFLSTGGFDTTKPFPHSNDIDFWEKCIKEYNTTLLRVRSYAYHFQALSTR